MRQGHGPRGESLVEVLLVVTLLGAAAASLAPFQTFLQRRLGPHEIEARPAALAWPVRRLVADARAALDTRVESASSVRFSLAGGREVVWLESGGGVERIDGGGLSDGQRSFPGAALRIARPARNLLSATWSAPPAGELEVEIWLRHEGRP